MDSIKAEFMILTINYNEAINLYCDALENSSFT